MSVGEAARLRALQGYGVLDTPPAAAFDRVTAMAADLFEAPIALVSLVEAERQWFKSRVGLEACETPREWSFCSQAITLGPDAVMVVEDASRDPRFGDNPLVTGAPAIRFYAGAVLTSPAGFNLGALCVIDTEPRPALTARQEERLRSLARIVVDEMELARTLRLTAERERLLAMAEGLAKVGYWRLDVATERLTWSDEVYRLHGVDRGSFEPTLERVKQLLDPDSREQIRRIVAEVVGGAATAEAEIPIHRPGGEVRRAACTASGEHDAEGRVCAVFGVVQDVTEHAEALAAAERSRARYKLLADGVADVITRIRFDGSSSYISPSIKRLIGYRPVEMEGRFAQDFVYEPDRPLILEVFAEMEAGLEEKTVEHRAQHRDGAPVWVETHFQLLRDAEGRPAEMVAVIRNLEERKAIETELRRAQAEAEEAAAVKAEFLANMSHELRTPLTAVLGFSKLAREQPELSPETQVMLDRAVYAGRSLLSTVNDILDFSKLEAGQVEITPVLMSPVEISLNTLDIFAGQAEAKGLTLETGGLEDLPAAVTADADRVRQVLVNLIGNAVKFTTVGGVRLDVSYADGALTFSVTDTGPGIPPDRLDRLFKRFSQVDGSSTRRHGGTGLGLAICRGLVEAMGGEIGVESDPGRGSRFWFRAPAPAVEGEGRDWSLLPPGCRVLVADDNPANRELMRAILSPFGVEMTEACDGAAAVALAQEAPFDIVLMDLRMPVMGGLEAAERIRAEPGPNPHIPILAFSASEPSRTTLACFDGHVSKPVSAQALIVALAAALSGGDKGAAELDHAA